MPRKRRALPTDTTTQRILCMAGLTAAIYLPPAIIFTLLQHTLHIHP